MNLYTNSEKSSNNVPILPLSNYANYCWSILINSKIINVYICQIEFDNIKIKRIIQKLISATGTARICKSFLKFEWFVLKKIYKFKVWNFKFQVSPLRWHIMLSKIISLCLLSIYFSKSLMLLNNMSVAKKKGHVNEILSLFYVEVLTLALTEAALQ